MEWTFLEDKQQLDGASTAKLRDHFREWVKQSAPPRNSSETRPREPNPPGLESSFDNTMSDEYFVQVDDTSLRSIVYKELPPAEANLDIRGHINLVSAEWEPARLEDYHGDRVIEDHFSFPELEGCTEENVGWMRLAGSEVGLSTFERIPHLWYIVYERPPDILYRV
ncbi:hypothetical protein BDP55DRAFT_152272 [Colletotrichum godetiae]|uniref:Uncharacterized protein n=1 Tax=Colletotrichum godetiae TaxID=1209918 RepID=A0AAJ0ETT2_9PEZI|nr:uncharacterized protein BDP55DRAFT_152272 [Colletotrichum godetiae]KAK1675367.1 hypothetical protein BDP55DRAFT_152272 [Colletotrichum godetiae]